MRVSILHKNGLKTIDLNRRRAIRERCLNCSGWQPGEVDGCKITDCPLYRFRSAAGKQDAKARNKAIQAYCRKCCNGQKTEVLKCPAVECPLFAYRRGVLDRSVEIKQIEPILENVFKKTG